MKNLILLLCFFYLSLVSNGQVKFNGNIETGYEDRVIEFSNQTSKDYPIYRFKNNLYCAIKLNLEFNGFEIYVRNKRSFYHHKFINFNPELNENKIGARYTHKIFTIGYDYMRSHLMKEDSFSEACNLLFLRINSSNLNLILDKGIQFNGSLETGIESRSINFNPRVYHNPYFITKEKDNFYGILGFDVNFKGFNIYTSSKTYFSQYSLLSYTPLLVEYIIGTKYVHKKFTLGYEHMCAHSIEEKYFNEGYDRLFLHFNLFSKTFDKK